MSGADRFCPACGQGRTGFLRYCRRCGFDFEAETAPLPAEPEPVDVPTEGIRTPSVVGPTLARGRLGRYAVGAVGGLLIIGGLANAMSPAAPSESPSAPSPSDRAVATRTPSPTVEASATPTFGPTGLTESAVVARVVDGDTIRVILDGIEYPLRYIGIDSPEPDAADPAVRAMADAATAANAALVSGKAVVLERDVSETDQFGRLLRHVWIEGETGWVLVNQELVRRGVAQVTTYPPDVRYVELLTEAQESARVAAVGLWAPSPTPTPVPTAAPTPAPRLIDTPITITAEARERFEGGVGASTWSDLFFESDRVTVRWSVSASSRGDCRVAWQLQPGSGAVIKSTVRVEAGQSETGNRRYDTPFGSAAFLVDSSCGSWSMSMQGYEVASGGGGGGSSCDSSYPDVCIPPYPPDLDCGDITERRFAVRGPDPHGFDGDNDGIGCESG